MSVKTTLAMARDIVNAGWCQGDFQDDQGNYCAIGALCKATVYGPVYERALMALRDQLPSDAPAAIAVFNDRPGTTKQDVLDLFDKAIANLP